MPLTRRTPIRSTSDLKRTPFQRKPAKPKEGADERRTWLLQWTCCFVCGQRARLDCHEIVTRARSVACFVLANLIATCRKCHDTVLVWMPTVGQLAIKRIADPENFDLQEVNRLRHRDEGSITHQEVKNWQEMILSLRGQAA